MKNAVFMTTFSFSGDCFDTIFRKITIQNAKLRSFFPAASQAEDVILNTAANGSHFPFCGITSYPGFFT